VKSKTPLLVTVLGFAALAQAQSTEVPTNLQPPAGEKLVLKTHATGWQIYTCGAGADGKPAWTLKAPDAQLHDAHGAVVAHHSAGPAWTHHDGSEVTGKAVEKAAAPDGKSIPWLLLTATGHSGKGVFDRVSSIQRVHTKGGQPPAADQCDPARPTPEARSPYSADYYFYAPANAK
jgi:hypothetical protein